MPHQPRPDPFVDAGLHEERREGAAGGVKGDVRAVLLRRAPRAFEMVAEPHGAVVQRPEVPLEVGEHRIALGRFSAEAKHPSALLPDLQHLEQEGMNGDLPLPVLRLRRGDDHLALVAIDGLVHVQVGDLVVEEEIVEAEGRALVRSKAREGGDEVDRPPVVVDLVAREQLLEVGLRDEDHLVAGKRLAVGELFDHAFVRERVRDEPGDPCLRDRVVEEPLHREEHVPHREGRERLVRIGLRVLLLRFPNLSLGNSPLSQFQAKLATKDDTKRMVLDINAALLRRNANIDDARVMRSFERAWPDFAAELDAIPKKELKAPPPPTADQTTNELLSLVRSLGNNVEDLRAQFQRLSPRRRAARNVPMGFTPPFEAVANVALSPNDMIYVPTGITGSTSARAAAVRHASIRDWARDGGPERPGGPGAGQERLGPSHGEDDDEEEDPGPPRIKDEIP